MWKKKNKIGQSSNMIIYFRTKFLEEIVVIGTVDLMWWRWHFLRLILLLGWLPANKFQIHCMVSASTCRVLVITNPEVESPALLKFVESTLMPGYLHSTVNKVSLFSLYRLVLAVHVAIIYLLMRIDNFSLLFIEFWVLNNTTSETVTIKGTADCDQHRVIKLYR